MTKQNKTTKLLRSMNRRPEIKTPIGTDIFIPNNSGEHQKSIKRNTPVLDIDLINKSYVDSNFLSDDFTNGTIHEQFNALTSSDGAIVTMSLEQNGGGDLTLHFSDGNTILDTTPAKTIELTAGTDTTPQENFIYIPIETKVLTKSTIGFPSSGEHIKIVYLFVPSATFVQNEGVYINQNWNDFLSATDKMGHLAHIGERIRRDGAIYFAGIGGNGTDGYLTPTAGNTSFKSNSGFIYQMHKHAFDTFDTSVGDLMLVKNWSGDPYHALTNLYDIINDNTGTGIGANKYFNLVIWGVGNKHGDYHPMMINLPSGSYSTESNATNDRDGYDDFGIPREFNRESSTGFLIARVTIRLTNPWTIVETLDLRGGVITAAGGSSGVTDHGALTGLSDDDHLQYSLVTGTRSFTGTVGGITPVATTDLTTKAYVDAITSGLWEVDGTETQLITADEIDMQSKAIENTSSFLSNDGTISLPVYTFSGDPDTGMYWGSENNLAFTAGGKQMHRHFFNTGTNTGTTVYNENAEDIDFRVETSSNQGALYVDGGNNRVGLLTSTPDTDVEIAGAELLISSTTVTINADTISNFSAQESIGIGPYNDFQAAATAAGATISTTTNGSGLFVTFPSSVYPTLSADIFFQFAIPQSIHGTDVTIRSVTFYYAITGNCYINENELFKVDLTNDGKTSIDNDTTNITTGTSHSFSSLPNTINTSTEQLSVRIKAGILTGSPTSGTLKLYGFKITYDTA